MLNRIDPNDTNKQGMPIVVVVIAVVILLLGSTKMPYGYYTFERLVATIAFGWAAVDAHHRRMTALPWLFGLCALIFNPFVKVHFDKETWAVIDIVAGLFLLVTQLSIALQIRGQAERKSAK